MENKLIKVDDEDGVFLRDKFENFLKKTNLWSEDIYLRERGLWKSLIHSPVAEIFFSDDHISVNVEKCNLERVKRLFEDFVKINPIKINISLVRGDC